ncbi:hypothetical protein Tco_1064445 [Tanacetum coccineum]
MVTGVEDPKLVGRVRSAEDMNCAINDLASKFASMSTKLDETRSATMGDGGNHSNRKGNNHVIIEQRVKDNQKARILELKRRNHVDYSSTKEDLYAVSRRTPYAIFKYKSWNILEYNNCGPHAKKPQYVVLNSFNMAYRPNSKAYKYRTLKMNFSVEKLIPKTEKKALTTRFDF